MGYPSLSNGYDGARELFLNNAQQDRRVPETKRTEYSNESFSLFQLCANEIRLCKDFKLMESVPLNIVLPFKKLITEDLIYLNGRFLFVREDFAEILMKFNLGGTKLFNVGYPIGMNGGVIYNYKFYLLNITEWRNYFIPEESTLISLRGVPKDGFEHYSLGNSYFVKSKVALSKLALKCDVDIWHDPMLDYSIFFSDRLKKALDEKGLLVQTKHKKCLVVALEGDN